MKVQAVLKGHRAPSLSSELFNSDSLADRHSCGPMISPDALSRGGTMMLQGWK